MMDNKSASAPLRVVLASESARRREVLKMLGVRFTTAKTDFDEKTINISDPAQLVAKLSHMKSLHAQLEIDSSSDERILVISADTVVAFDGEILGKPRDSDDACAMLRRLSGSVHEVYTGLTLRLGERLRTYVEITTVEFRTLTDREIELYVSSGEPLDKAGSYGIQERGAMFVRRINGDYWNVVGMPVALLNDALRDDFDLSLCELCLGSGA